MEGQVVRRGPLDFAPASVLILTAHFPYAIIIREEYKKTKPSGNFFSDFKNVQGM